MNMKKEYPNIRIPMYIATTINKHGMLVESSYKTRAELQAMINERLELFNSPPLREDDDYITQSKLLLDGTLFIITTVYLQTTVSNE